MKLDKIIKNCGVVNISGNADIDIKNICSDSRKISSNSLFFAIKGFAFDGHEYIHSAIKAGAKAIIYENDFETHNKDSYENIPDNGYEYDNICFVKVRSSRYAMAIAAANFYDNPSRKLKLVGITGTNGKTTTVTLLYNLFTKLGYSCGLLSTIANYVGTKRSEAANTTSDPITINSLLAEMVSEGCEYCFMEVSSIGVEQERVEGLKFELAIFSNLTHDHLDYHKTFAEYLRCKKIFFDKLDKESVALINIDDKNGEVMVQNTKAKVKSYSCRTKADHNCKILEQSFEGMLLKIDSKEIWTRLIGEHNAYNILAIYSAAVELGSDAEEVLIALSSLESAPGRMQSLYGPDNRTVVIDYAHTPDALENVLKTLKNIGCAKNIICLFGCGGNRDKSKRSEMAEVAEKYADRLIITSDNSRNEKTSDIIEDIKQGLSTQGKRKALYIEDREQAIRTAIMTSSANDVILLAGKGHETYQILGNEKFHFDEKEIVKNIFEDLV